MITESLQLHQTNAADFKNEIVNDVCAALKKFAETLHNPDNNILLTREQTAEMLQVSLVTLWTWTKNNLIPAHKIGNKVRYKKHEVLQSLQQMKNFNELFF